MAELVPATARSNELRVSYRDLKRFALRTMSWVGLLVVPAVAATFFISQRSQSVYLAEATVLAPLRNLDIESLGDTPAATLPLAPTAYEAALGSRDVVEDALRRLGVEPSGSDSSRQSTATADLRAATKFRFEESRRSTLLMIGALAATAPDAAARANALTDALVAWDDARARAEAAARVTALGMQLDGLESQLAELRSLGNRASTPQLNSLSLLAAEVRAELAVARSLAVAARGNLEVLQRAARASQLRPSPLVNSLVIAALGTLFVMTVLLVRASQDQVVNGAEGLEAVTGLPVLASFTNSTSPELPYLKAHIDRALPNGGSVMVVGITPDDASDVVVRALSESFDLPGSETFINSSPALLASAAAVDRTAVYDLVILVADPRHTRRDDLREAFTWLDRAHANVLGIVAVSQGGVPRHGAADKGSRGGRAARTAVDGRMATALAEEGRPDTGLGAS